MAATNSVSAFVGIGASAVKPGDHYLKEVGAHCHMGGAADEVNQGRHADQTAADPQDARHPAGGEADENRQPGGAGNLGLFEGDHRGNLDLVQGLVPFNARGQLVHHFPGRQSLPVFAFFLGHVGKNHPGDEGQEDEVEIAHHFFHRTQTFQPHDHLVPTSSKPTMVPTSMMRPSL